MTGRCNSAFWGWRDAILRRTRGKKRQYSAVDDFHTPFVPALPLASLYASVHRLENRVLDESRYGSRCAINEQTQSLTGWRDESRIPG